MKTAIRSSRNRERYQLLFMAMPFMLLVFFLMYVPIFGWSLAFFEYHPGIPLLANKFIDLDNFIAIFTDSVDMLRVIKNTLLFAFLSLAMTPLPMFFAMLLNEISVVKYKRIIQTITTLPHFLSWIIIYSLAFAIFASDGVLNDLLIAIGIIDTPTNVLGNAKAVYIFQTLLGVWKGIGWSAIIYLAAIVGIPKDLYEAAYIDGANRFQTAIFIILPNLLQTYIVLLILHIGNFINVGFEQYFVFKNPVTLRSIETIDLYVYKLGLLNQDYSYSISIGILKSAISIILIFMANRLAKKVRGHGII